MTALLLVVAALLAAAPTFLVYEWSTFIWVCQRDEARAGYCYAEPTLGARLGLDPYWNEELPHTHSMRIVPIIDLGEAHAIEAGWVHISSSDACWDVSFGSWCRADRRRTRPGRVFARKARPPVDRGAMLGG